MRHLRRAYGGTFALHAPGRRVQAFFYRCGGPNPTIGLWSNVFCIAKVVLRIGTNVIISPDASLAVRNAWLYSQGPVVGPLVNGEEWRPTGDDYLQCKHLPGFEPKEELCLEYKKFSSPLSTYVLKYRGVNVDVNLLFSATYGVEASLKNGAKASENYGFCGGRNPGSMVEVNGISLAPGRDNRTTSMPSPEPAAHPCRVLRAPLARPSRARAAMCCSRLGVRGFVFQPRRARMGIMTLSATYPVREIQMPADPRQTLHLSLHVQPCAAQTATAAPLNGRRPRKPVIATRTVCLH